MAACSPSTSVSCARRSRLTAARKSTRRATRSSTSSHARAMPRPRPPTVACTRVARLAGGCRAPRPHGNAYRRACPLRRGPLPRDGRPPDRANHGRRPRRADPRVPVHRVRPRRRRSRRHLAARSRRAQPQGPRASGADLRAPGGRPATGLCAPEDRERGGRPDATPPAPSRDRRLRRRYRGGDSDPGLRIRRRIGRKLAT